MPKKVESVGCVVKRLREKKGMSRNKLAQAAESAAVNIKRLEECERGVMVETMLRIARALDVSLAEFDHCEAVPPSQRA